jgi:group I intron endonuclease
LFYGHDNFTLEILEYCDKTEIIKREQYYIDKLNPEYNISKTAGSILGYKHTLKTRLKMKTRKLSDKALANLKAAKAGIAPSAFTRARHLAVTGHPIVVENKENNTIKIYNSIRGAARELGVSHATLLNYIKSKKLLKDIYMITKFK